MAWSGGLALGSRQVGKHVNQGNHLAATLISPYPFNNSNSPPAAQVDTPLRNVCPGYSVTAGLQQVRQRLTEEV